MSTPIDACSFIDCGRPVYNQTRQLCMGHYKQHLAGKELKPIRKYKRFPKPGPGKKICNDCERVKDLSDFYLKNGGYPFATCKACTIKRHRAHNLAREARQEAVLSE
jgi:hypothetical protein